MTKTVNITKLRERDLQKGWSVYCGRNALRRTVALGWGNHVMIPNREPIAWVVKRCGCKAVYDLPGWSRLRFVGTLGDGAHGGEIELRQCGECGSTIAVRARILSYVRTLRRGPTANPSREGCRAEEVARMDRHKAGLGRFQSRRSPSQLLKLSLAPALISDCEPSRSRLRDAHRGLVALLSFLIPRRTVAITFSLNGDGPSRIERAAMVHSVLELNLDALKFRREST